MNLNEYQDAARRTAIYADQHRVIYPALGLASEAGGTVPLPRAADRCFMRFLQPMLALPPSRLYYAVVDWCDRMSVVPLTLDGEPKSVVTATDQFDLDGYAVLIRAADENQLRSTDECNVSYDLRIGERYRDHRESGARELEKGDYIKLLPGNSVIIETAEEVHFPKRLFGQIVPKVSLLQQGIANTPTKIDPGYSGPLLITAFNHGKRPVRLARGDRFCAMFVQTVGDGVRPYNKPGKRLRGVEPRRPWQRTRDFLEANSGVFTAVLLLATAILLIVSALNTFVLLSG